MPPGRQICPPCVCPLSIRSKPELRGPTVDFRGVRKQDRNTTSGNLRCRFFNVVDSKEMRVVDPRKIDRGAPALDNGAFVEKNPDAERLQVGDHRDRIVIAEHSIDFPTKCRAQARDGFETGSAIAVGAPAIVAGQNAEIIIEARREFSGAPHCGAAHVCMQIAQMQNGEAVESAREICEAYDVMANLHLACVG